MLDPTMGQLGHHVMVVQRAPLRSGNVRLRHATRLPCLGYCYWTVYCAN